MGEGQDENAIVTSTGQFVIAWDFAKVKKGMLDRYEIKKYEDKVVQDNFKFNDDKEIVRSLRFFSFGSRCRFITWNRSGTLSFLFPLTSLTV